MNEAAKVAICGGEPHRAGEALHSIARRLMWWQPPAVSLQQPRRFIAQVMALGTWTDVRTAWRAFGEGAFQEALREAPPGVFDPRSWIYWHHVFRWLPVPPLPRRSL
jgi:hypothetical protein